MSDPRVCLKLRNASLQLLRAFTSTATNEHTFFQSRRKPVQVQKPVNPISNTSVIETSSPSKTEIPNQKEYTKRIFSGIQPTGNLHLGNYLGAIQQWIKLQETENHISFCIVDLHSITLPQRPDVLHDNIAVLAATMLACGIDQEKSNLFVQSAVKEHAELSWILGTQCTVARLGHLPQFKEKSRLLKEVPLGLYLYPVLQAADICLYKTTHVPVGEDQIQHIQLAQYLAKTFNTKFGETFPICNAVVSKEASRIRSLRDPSKKMSKSDTDMRATINLMDEPDVIVEKFKKALTDFTSDVTYEPETRPGVSNIVAMHALITGRSITEVLEEALNMDTGRYKLRVADIVAEHLKPIRTQIKQQLLRRNEITYILDQGAEKARLIAAETMTEVYAKMGLGHNYMPSIANYMRCKRTVKNQQQEAADIIDTYNSLDVKPVQSATSESIQTSNKDDAPELIIPPNKYDTPDTKVIPSKDIEIPIKDSRLEAMETYAEEEAPELRSTFSKNEVPEIMQTPVQDLIPEPMKSPTKDETSDLVNTIAKDNAMPITTPELEKSSTKDDVPELIESPIKHEPINLNEIKENKKQCQN